MRPSYQPTPITILDPDNFEDAEQVYGGHEEVEIDDATGDAFEWCPGSDSGHLFKTECGVTVCLHCGEVAWQ